jgi:hypothetical protein
MKNKFFTLRAGLMRPFDVLSEDRSMLIAVNHPRILGPLNPFVTKVAACL